MKVDAERLRKQLQSRIKEEETIRTDYEEKLVKQEKELKIMREKGRLSDELSDELQRLKDRRSKVS